MKKLLFICLFLFSNAYAVDLKQAAQELQTKYLESNKTLSSMESQIFSERQSLLSEIDRHKTAIKTFDNKSLDRQITALQKELDSCLLEVENLENEKEIFQSSILEQRRQFETVLTQRELDQNAKSFEKWDQLLDKKELKEALAQNFDLAKTIMATGLKVHLSQGKVADNQGLIQEAQVLALGRAKNYYLLDTLSGIGSQKRNSIYPQITAVNGTKQAFTDFANNGECSLNIDFSNGLVFKDSAKKKTLQEHLKAGGIMVYPLLLLGAICVLIASYKFIQLYSIRSQYDDKVVKLICLLKEGKNEEAEAYVSQLKKPIRALLSEALKYKDAPREDLEELLNETILSELPRLDRLMHILSVSAGAAPLMGLLGTVMGIIKTFEMIGIYGTADTNQLSLGISEALVTTEVGLIVAIPTLITYAILNRRLRSIVSNLEKASLSFINGLRAE
jgi:biopolymer transport protein ExbB